MKYFQGPGWILALLFLSLICGWALFQTFDLNGSIMNSLALMVVIVSPLFLIYEDWAKKGLVAILLLTLPLNISQTQFLRPHIGGAQGLIISLNGLALFFLYLLLFLDLIRDRQTDFRLLPFAGLPLIGMLFFAALSLIGAPDRMLGFFELLEFVRMYLNFLYIFHYARTEKNSHWILFVLLAGLCLENGIALLQQVTGSSLNLRILGGHEAEAIQTIGGDRVFRMGGTLGNSNSLAWYLDFLLPLTVSLLFLKHPRWIRTAAFSCFFPGIVVLVLTFSRGGWIGFLVGGLIVLIMRLRRASLRHRFYLGIFVILLLAMTLTLLAGFDNPVKERFTADDNQSAYVRLPLMRVAWNMIKSNPITGVGLNNYTLVHHLYDQTSEQVSSHFPYPVHNLFLQLGAEIGIIGLGFFFLFLLMTLWYAFRLASHCSGLEQTVGIGVLGGIVAGMIQGLVENATIGSYHLLPLWILAGWASGLAHELNKPAEGTQ